MSLNNTVYIFVHTSICATECPTFSRSIMCIAKIIHAAIRNMLIKYDNFLLQSIWLDTWNLKCNMYCTMISSAHNGEIIKFNHNKYFSNVTAATSYIIMEKNIYFLIYFRMKIILYPTENRKVISVKNSNDDCEYYFLRVVNTPPSLRLSEFEHRRVTSQVREGQFPLRVVPQDHSNEHFVVSGLGWR